MQDYNIVQFRKVNDPKDTKGIPEHYDTFADLAAKFKDCVQLDNKLKGRGWVRGELKDNIRKKENITQTKVIIVDGDQSSKSSFSACPASLVHEVLKDCKLSHFIYSSFSNDPANNVFRWRLVVPCNKAIQSDEVALNTAHLVKTLNDLKADVLDANENKAMSQMWFNPASPDPESRFEFYEFHGGDDYVVESVPLYESDTKPGGYDRSGALETKPDVIAQRRTLDELEQLISTGAEFHEPMRNLTYQAIQDGMSVFWAERYIRNLVRGLPMDDRLEQRLRDLPRLIDRVSVEAGEYKTDFTFEKQYEDDILQPPLAPGMMGNLIREAMEAQVYVNRAVATATCLGLIAGVCGRRYIAPLPQAEGCNEYFLVSMRTGGGKDFINKFISRSLRECASVQSLEYRKFIGAQSFTGGKALRGMLEEKRVCVSVLTELGKMLQSQAGDQASLRRGILDLYSKSGPGVISEGEMYSKKDDDIAPLESPAFTLVGEAEPSGFIKTLNDTNSLNDGFLPRSIVFRADGKRPYAKDECRKELSTEIKEQISKLMAICINFKEPLVINVEASDSVRSNMKQHEKYWTDIDNNFRKSDPPKAIMATRCHVHAAKMGSLCAIINSGNVTNVEMKMEDWEFGKAMAKYSFDSITDFLDDSGTGGDSFADTLAFVADKLRRLFTGEISGNNYKLDKYCEKKNNTVSHRVFYNLFFRTPIVKKLEIRGYKNELGYTVLVEYLLDKEYMLDCTNSGKQYYTLTSKILEVM